MIDRSIDKWALDEVAILSILRGLYKSVKVHFCINIETIQMNAVFREEQRVKTRRNVNRKI